MYQPPLTLMVWPVMNSLSARSAAARPISSGEPKKPTGRRSGEALGIAGDHVGSDEGGSNGVGGDAFLGKERGVGVREADQAGLGGRVVRADDTAGLRSDGRKIDDTAPAALAHAAKNSIGDEEGGF
jgi:hypothetical protein